LLAIRSLLFVALFYLWSAFIAIGSTPILFGPSRWSLRMFHTWASGIHLLLRVCCDVRVEIRGREHVPQGAALVAAKHECMLDVFSQFAFLPRTVFVMKKELGWIPWFAWYARKVHTIVIDRGAHSAALRQLVREAKERFAEQRQVLIFPEGTRCEPGAAPDYKPGIAALYRELNVPVHPVATNSGVHWPAHGFLRRPGVIVFEFLEPIAPGLKRAEFMRLLEERIETASNKLLPL
jgi:1-acyl-sn-glycerol-3-phosphate acyltransferase